MSASKRAPNIRALVYYRDQFGKVAGLGVLSMISGTFQTLALVLVVPLAKTISDGKNKYDGHLGSVKIHATTGQLALIAIVAILVAAALDISIAWGRSKMMTAWEYHRREQVIGEYLATDYQTQAAERLGTLPALTNYVSRGTIALGAIVTTVGAALTILIFLVAALRIDYRAAIFLIATIAGLSLLLRPVMVRTKRYSQELSKILVDYSQEVTEGTRMARDVRVFHAGKPLGDRLTGISARVAHVRQRAAFAQAVTSPVYQYAGLLLIVGALGASQGMAGGDIAKLGTIALLLLRSMTFGQQIQNAYQNLLDCAPYIDKLEEMRAVYAAHQTDDGSVSLESVHSLELDNVSFSYDGEATALADVSVTFPVGEIVGIVGPSGSGKSTLSQLILRLRKPTDGQILVNRTPADEYTLASWYQHVSLVPQDPRLLHTTVAENIAFLDMDITREQIERAAQAAGVHDVIMTLEHGYDTLIGPAFRDLSGGQIQRIGIARALARGAQVLVLDEPTSALDVHSEAVIQATLERLRGDVLVLIIAHRLSTLSICDRIMVLQEGRIETVGSLSEVSERSEFFRRALDAGTLELGVPQTDAP